MFYLSVDLGILCFAEGGIAYTDTADIEQDSLWRGFGSHCDGLG